MLGQKTAAQGTMGMTVQASFKNLMKQPQLQSGLQSGTDASLSLSLALHPPRMHVCAQIEHHVSSERHQISGT